MSTATVSPTNTATADWTAIVHEIGAMLRDGADERDRTGEISRAAFERLRMSGLTGALVPVDLGGGGTSHAEMGEVLRVLGRYDGATAVALSMHAHLVAAQVWRHHHGMDASGVLRKVAGGKVLISTGASDWLSANGAARRVEGGYRVSARKASASACEVGDILVTSIRWEDADQEAQVLHCAIPFDAPGVSIELTWDTLGLRATGSHTVVLNDVFVPDAAISLARPAGEWHPIWNTVLGAALPLIMSAYLGIADAAVGLARTAAEGRSEPHVVQLIGEMMNAHTTAADVIAAMFGSADNLRFENTNELASQALSRKTVAVDALIETVRLAMEVAGGAGYGRAFGLERLYRDVLGCMYHPLPRAKQTLFTGRVVLGLDPV